jgi:membrane associated rhomboid family serine protease
MWFLWIFGDNVEDRLGHVLYLLFYILCGIAGSLLHIVTNPNSTVPSIGASGAIAGVMGGYLFLFPKARIKTVLIIIIFIQVVRIPAVLVLGYWIVIQILSGVAEFGARKGAGIAWFAHVGGFILGFFFAVLLRKKGREAMRKRHG